MNKDTPQGKEANETYFDRSNYLGIKEVSSELRVSEGTVLRWIRAEKLVGFFRIGRKWLIRRSDFNSFINHKVEETSK